MPNYPKDDFEPPRPSGLIWQAILFVIVLVMLSSVFAQGDESGKMPGIVGEKIGPGRIAGIASAGGRLSVYDGDTFTLDGERVRIAAIDTPERSTPQCDAERRLARLARLRLLQLLGDGSAIALERQPLPDRYGRTLARVTVNGVDVSTVLIREGLAVQWEGKRHSWCCG